jgi:hypothetical protein
MRLTVPHHTTKENARKAIDERLGQALAQYGHYLNESQHQWDGEKLTFSGAARGFKVSGSMEITDTDVIIEGKLPLIAKPFEPRIKSAVEKEAAGIFPAA